MWLTGSQQTGAFRTDAYCSETALHYSQIECRYLRFEYQSYYQCELVQAPHLQTQTGNKKQALYNLFAAYVHTVPLEKLIESVERGRRDAQLRYVVIYGTACSYCLGRAKRLDGSYLRTFALELKEQLAQTLVCHVDSDGAA
jgi:hypothetical protein